jgi:hypothetical protein
MRSSRTLHSFLLFVFVTAIVFGLIRLYQARRTSTGSLWTGGDPPSNSFVAGSRTATDSLILLLDLSDSVSRRLLRETGSVLAQKKGSVSLFVLQLPAPGRDLSSRVALLSECAKRGRGCLTSTLCSTASLKLGRARLKIGSQEEWRIRPYSPALRHGPLSTL